MPGDLLREQIRRPREMTDRPFGCEHHADEPVLRKNWQKWYSKSVSGCDDWCGFSRQIHRYVERGRHSAWFSVVRSVAYAKRMESLGADAVVAEGTEAGGHIGETSSMVWFRRLLMRVTIPGDRCRRYRGRTRGGGRFMLGAEGVQLGTRFWP
jgi:enoyl-[acyl-carrier protein] reductase II